MDSIWIQGGKRLEGDIQISGAKNSALTLLPCALLTEEPVTLGNLPRLADVDSFGHLLNELGVSTTVRRGKGDRIGREMRMSAKAIASTVAPNAAGIDFDLPLREAREQFERAYLQHQLQRSGGSVGKLAKAAGMERTHLYRKLRDLGVEVKNAVRDD